jgi:hypothetical protein
MGDGINIASPVPRPFNLRLEAEQSRLFAETADELGADRKPGSVPI